ncbi:hypothetical protein METBIDRAFT_30255 [Metschnikowia bicuspidata var. bicuspidata NRRL YB-4993]|uniref:Uncharacterized protein n=1 Tax=Metschnikowia bicuspidata var. bicuspidata NRRL YB-4993 TaxID=869754 RepID=A0A1A0HIQ0_9ASCO|nr:hypothetical protein METBIDRAFT_30255 [Metschnikowia bicuspidata var. bicuspidata NRRL YB-4993]OBA23881.1 hypothetical protein METBIDRAFT_30255 [Metschnikowia bicuspidata var. bicuspidata NRRL YB-4993]
MGPEHGPRKILITRAPGHGPRRINKCPRPFSTEVKEIQSVRKCLLHPGTTFFSSEQRNYSSQIQRLIVLWAFLSLGLGQENHKNWPAT